MKTNSFISSPVTKTLVYANVFVALCAAAQVVVTYMLFAIPINYLNNSFIVFVGLSTFLQYNMQRGYLINATNLNTESAHWLTAHKKQMFYSVALALIIVLFLCNNLSYTSVGIMVGAELISTIYYMPPFNLRKQGYVKPLIIAAIWVISCSVVPLIENQLLTLNSGWFLASQFIFITVLCILFDIKDMTDDYLNGINTYANRFGVVGTKIICLLLVVLSAVCFYLYKHTITTMLAQLLVLLITAVTVLLTNEKKHRFYYYLWIDGLLILQAILFYAFLFSKN